MTSTYTTNIGINQPGLGDYAGSWNAPVNADWALIDQALGSSTSVAFTNMDFTVTVAQSAYFQIICTGTLTSNVNLIFPATIGGRRIITNNCTGSFTLTALNGASDAGGGVVITQGINTPILLTQAVAYLDVPPASLEELPLIGNATVLGNVAGGAAHPAALTTTQLTTLVNTFTSLLSGAVPASAGGISNFLRADGSFSPLSSSSTVCVPQARLTLSSGLPILSSAVIGATSVYVTPFNGQLVPQWNGSTFVPSIFSETSQLLSDSTLSPSGASANNLYDIFVWTSGGTIVCSRGPAWMSSSARGTGAGTTQLIRVQGFLVNQYAIANGPAAGYGLYVGTIICDAGAATVTFNPTPAAASGGPTNGAWIGLWNEYNRTPIGAYVRDSKASWSYSTASWTTLDSSSNNRISFIIGQSEDSISGLLIEQAESNASNDIIFGIGVNSTTVPSGAVGEISVGSSSASTFSVASSYIGLPSSGLTYLQALQYGTSPNIYGAGPTSGQAMQLSVQLRY